MNKTIKISVVAFLPFRKLKLIHQADESLVCMFFCFHGCPVGEPADSHSVHVRESLDALASNWEYRKSMPTLLMVKLDRQREVSLCFTRIMK